MTQLAEALTTALQHHQAGQFAEAQRLYQVVLQQQPNHPNALYFLGLLAHQTGQLPTAIELYQAAIAAQPDYAEAHVNLGAALQQQGRTEAAIGHYQAALRANPNNANAHINLGVTLQQQGRLEAAIGRFQKAIQLNPNLVEAYSNLGHVLKEMGELEQAITQYQTALQRQPNDPDIYRDLGDVLQDVGRFDEAIGLYDRALALNPNHVTVRGSRIRALLISGNLQQGFAEYDPWRLGLSSQARSFPQPAWQGEALEGKSILLYPEAGAGLGDTLQFVRYAPLVAERGGRVIIECQEPLLRLLRRVEGIEKVVVTGGALPTFDVQASLLSLPHILGTTLETIPNAIPYLAASKRPSFHIPVPENTHLKVGLVWGGNPEHLQDRDRSCPLQEFQAFLQLPGIAFYSLQKGAHRSELTNLSEGSIVDLSDRLGDFADTATAIAQLDQVITVDTAVAHLAGAMGKSVWILLAFAPDWRWLMNRTDSPWYPTARLFRQPRRQDWASVCNQVATALQTEMAQRK